MQESTPSAYSTGKAPRPYQSPKLLSMANAALNGAVGDSLSKSNHPFTTKPGFYYRGSPITNPNLETIAGSKQANKLTIFLHGLCCDEFIWQFPVKHFDNSSEDSSATDYGDLLFDALGYRPFYYRYNSGLSIAHNGEIFAQDLDKLIADLSGDIEEIVLVGYSMGGLVMKSAQAWGNINAATFLPLVSKSFYLGSPHHGAPLEKIAKMVNVILDRLPHPIVRIIGKIMGQRSQGIKDLGFSDVTSYDNNDDNGYWSTHIDHHFIGGTLHSKESHPLSLFLGDILVRQFSALPMKEEMQFVEKGIHYNYRLFPGVNHLQLQRDKGIFQYLLDSLSKQE